MILAGTGHRPDKLGGYEQDVFDRLVALASRRLESKKPELVISGMAMGWDLALAQAAKDLGIRYHAYIPCLGQDSLWSDDWKRRYRHLCHKADDYRLITINYSPAAMQKRNERMVEDSDVLLALWNGSPGGTANCIDFAEKNGCLIENLWDLWDL